MSLENIIFEGPVDEQDRNLYKEYFVLEVEQYIANLPKTVEEKYKKDLKHNMLTEGNFVDKNVLENHARYQGYKSAKLKRSPKEVGRVLAYFARMQVEELKQMPVELAEDHYGKFIEGFAAGRGLSYLDALIFVKKYSEEHVPEKLIGIIERSYQALEKKKIIEENNNITEKKDHKNAGPKPKKYVAPSVRPKPEQNLIFASEVSQDDVELYAKYMQVKFADAYNTMDQLLLEGKPIEVLEAIERQLPKKHIVTQSVILYHPGYVGYKIGVTGADHNAVGKRCAFFVEAQVKNIRKATPSIDMLAEFIEGFAKATKMEPGKAVEYVESCALGYADRKLFKIIEESRKKQKK